MYVWLLHSPIMLGESSARPYTKSSLQGCRKVAHAPAALCFQLLNSALRVSWDCPSQGAARQRTLMEMGGKDSPPATKPCLTYSAPRHLGLRPTARERGEGALHLKTTGTVGEDNKTRGAEEKEDQDRKGNRQRGHKGHRKQGKKGPS